MFQKKSIAKKRCWEKAATNRRTPKRGIKHL
jgi:hypothetical protein